MAIVRPDPTQPRPSRAYPHVTEVKDGAAQTSLRLLWDRVATMEANHTDLVDQLATARDTITTLTQRLLTAEQQVASTQLIAAKATSPQALPPGPGDTAQIGQQAQQVGTPAGGTLPGVTTQATYYAAGGFAFGINEGSAHLLPPIATSAFNIGNVVARVSNEWSALLAVAVDQPTRDANRAELIGRMIWHLNQVGYTAGMIAPQDTFAGNPYCLGVVIGVPVAYQVTGYETFTVPMTAQCTFVSFPISTFLSSGGIPD